MVVTLERPRQYLKRHRDRHLQHPRQESRRHLPLHSAKPQRGFLCPPGTDAVSSESFFRVRQRRQAPVRRDECGHRSTALVAQLRKTVRNRPSNRASRRACRLMATCVPWYVSFVSQWTGLTPRLTISAPARTNSAPAKARTKSSLKSS